MSNIGITRIFSARMLYSASLTGTAIFEDRDGYFPGKPIGLGTKDPFPVLLPNPPSV